MPCCTSDDPNELQCELTRIRKIQNDISENYAGYTTYSKHHKQGVMF